MRTFLLLIRLARPHFLLGGILMYALGVGIAHYLGVPIDWNLYVTGQVWGIFVQLSAHFLNEYFDSPEDSVNPNRTPFTGGSGVIGPGMLPRAAAMWGVVASLGGATWMTAVLLRESALSAAALVYMILIFLGAFFYAVPPIRLESTGYGELTTSILVAHLVPGFAYLLQAGDFHRLVAMATFPLVFVHMAMLLAFDLPDFGNDAKHGKRTLMVRIGWQAGMRMHNWMIIASFAMLALAVLLGLPSLIALPVFIAVPLGALQIWNMNRIAAGGKPNWTTLTLGAVSLFAMMAYLLAFSFWTR